MQNIQPLKRSEVSTAKMTMIPDSIINSVNELIKKHWNGHSASFKMTELLKLVLNSDDNLTSATIFEDHYFDFEELFRSYGWKVKFDQPGFNESYDAFFEFR